MKKQTLLFVFAVILLISSCSVRRDSVRVYEPNSNNRLLAGNDDVVPAEEIDRKIIYSATISLTVKKPDSVNAQLEQIAKKYEGYMTRSGTYQTTIRVKSEKLDMALEEISLLGKVQRKNIWGEDVTDEYLDYRIRLENAEKARKRYLELLAKAENVEAALKVEKELERLNGTIDMIKGKMNRIDHLAVYSTISVSLKEKKKPGALGYVGIGLYHSVKWLFVRN